MFVYNFKLGNLSYDIYFNNGALDFCEHLSTEVLFSFAVTDVAVIETFLSGYSVTGMITKISPKTVTFLCRDGSKKRVKIPRFALYNYNFYNRNIASENYSAMMNS